MNTISSVNYFGTRIITRSFKKFLSHSVPSIRLAETGPELGCSSLSIDGCWLLGLGLLLGEAISESTVFGGHFHAALASMPSPTAGETVLRHWSGLRETFGLFELLESIFRDGDLAACGLFRLRSNCSSRRDVVRG